MMRITLILCLFQVSVSAEPTEAELNRQFCQSVNGQTETRHFYTHAGGRSHTRVDCETHNMVYETGLDKRSSLDSLQQAIFFGVLTSKRPAVVLFNTDGFEGMYEYQIRMACQQAGVRYEVYQPIGGNHFD